MRSTNSSTLPQVQRASLHPHSTVPGNSYQILDRETAATLLRLGKPSGDLWTGWGMLLRRILWLEPLPSPPPKKPSQMASRTTPLASVSRLFRGIEENTGLGAGSANSGKNIGNSERQRLKSLFQNPPSDPSAPSRAVTSGFSPDEIAQGKAIINPQGWSLPNAARTLGNVLGGGGGLGKTIGMGTGGGIGLLLAPHLGISPEAGAAAGGAMAHEVGSVAKNFENEAVMRQAAALADKDGQRSPHLQSGQGPQGAPYLSNESERPRASAFLMTGSKDQQQQPQP